MEYTISKLASLSGVSNRTLRYYDEIGLLHPSRINSSGYRIYGQEEVDLLQQILFYRELDMNLEEIKQIIHGENFNIERALEHHHIQLIREKKRLEKLIQTVEATIQSHKGESKMTDKEKFEAFKKDQLRQNEDQYGDEIRQKYGKEVVELSNQKFSGMSQADYQSIERLTEDLNHKLAVATKENNPESEFGQEVAALHQQWIKHSWPENYYTEESHYNLSLMYIEDPRFKAYYEKIAPGAAEYLNRALKIYLNINEE